MSDNRENNKRIAKNTLLLYVRMLFTIVVSLYTSRIVLRTLGIEDFGIYSVVGGVVAMFGVVSASLSSAVSRYLNIEMGSKNEEKIKRIFSSAVTIHIFLAVTILVLAEVVGPWFISNKMTIPVDRIYAANWVFHCSILAFVINLISIPYNACVIAHENMKVFAYVSILEVFLKLAIVYVLLLFSIDKMILYAILTLCVALVIRVVYQLYCQQHYSESRFCFIFDYSLIKEMFGFASWNMIGSTSVILSDQGVNVLLNIFCNPIVNAARGVAMQVNQAINSFAQNFMLAVNPQITKSFGTNNLESFKSFMIYGSRLSVALLTLLSLPILADTKFILHLWLGQVPDYSVNFVRLALLYTLSESMSGTFTTGLLATGKIMKLQLLVGGFRMMNFPLSYGALLLWKIPEITFIIAIAISQINLFIRLTLLRKYVEISRFVYYKDIVLRQILTILIPLFIIYLLSSYMDESCVRLLMIVIISMCTCMICILYVTCNKYERILIFGKLYNILRKLGR